MKSSLHELLFQEKSLGIWMLPANFKIRVKTIISDVDRQNKVMDIYLYMVDLLSAYDNTLKISIDLYKRSQDNNEPGKTAAHNLLDKVLKERLALETKFLAARMDLVNNIEKDEWIEIFAPVEKNVNAE